MELALDGVASLLTKGGKHESTISLGWKSQLEAKYSSRAEPKDVCAENHTPHSKDLQALSSVFDKCKPKGTIRCHQVSPTWNTPMDCSYTLYEPKGCTLNKGTCPKCNNPYDDDKRNKTRHHIMPKRFFPGSWETIELCRLCHNQLENNIPVKEKKPDNFYYEVVNMFFGRKMV